MVKSNNSMSAEEKRWRAESDARTLSDALAIQKDGKRMAAAKKAAQDMIKATQERYQFANSETSKSKSTTKTTKKK